MYNENDENNLMTIEEEIDLLNEENPNKPAWYYRLSKIKGQCEKLLKPMNEFFKNDMAVAKLDKKVEDGYELIITEQDKSYIDSDKLVALLKKKKLRSAIKKVEVPDEDAVKVLVRNGEISVEEYQMCQVPKFTKVLNVKPVEVKGAAKG